MMTTRFGIRGLCGAMAATLFLGLALPALAWEQPQWVRQLGTSHADVARGVAIDGDGKVYISGYTYGSLGGTNQGADDAWVAKYSAAGALLWKRQLGTANYDEAYGVATDGDGNVHLAIDRGGDAWVAKHSAAGALLWKRQLGSEGYDAAYGVATDGDGNVYISGSGLNRGTIDAWLAKYSTAGDLVWARQFGSSDEEWVSGVATDRDGNVSISGWTRGLQEDDHAWVAKYSAAGALLWKRKTGTSLEDTANGVATDGDGNIYVSGWTAASNGSAWVAKYSATGVLLWKRLI